MQSIREYKPAPEDNRLYRRALWITVVGNVALASVKALAAYMTSSVALLADAANSISDVFYSILLVAGLWMSRQPPDEGHPQGHHRFEPLVGLVVTLSMSFAAYEAARASIDRFLAGPQAIELGVPTFVLLFSAGVKVFMFLIIRKLAQQTNSPALQTTAVDHISDVLTSLAAFFGILGSNFIAPIFDPIAGLLVSGWIFRAAFLAGRENLGYLTGAAAPEELREEIIRITQSVPGVEAVHHLVTEYAGPTLVVDLHINVDGDLSLRETHAISDRVIEALEAMPEVDRAYVHIEPTGWEG